MLQTVDVVIGFTVVMLILSVIVTFLVHFVVTTLLNLKGRVLKGGVTHLLMLLDKDGLSAGEATEIADHLLRHSLVGKKMLFANRWRLATVVHREDLTKLILDFAAGGDLTKADALAKGMTLNADVSPDLRTRLLASLKRNGIEDAPDEILKAVRRTMLALEQSQPELASDVRNNLALLTHASSEFVAKINSWFDQTIDRTVDIFTSRTRMWTIFFSTLVALFFQVNSFDVIKRLSVDGNTRQTLIISAIDHPDRFAGLAAPRNADEAQAIDKAASPLTFPKAIGRIKYDRDLKQLVEAGLFAWPGSGHEWLDYWTVSSGRYDFLVRLSGILLTIAFLGLGAPVWYDLLKNLLQLRSLVARRDDAQRLVRQTSQDSRRTAAEAPRQAEAARRPGFIPLAERGDLSVTG